VKSKEGEEVSRGGEMEVECRNRNHDIIEVNRIRREEKN
jgi:hypothetical protein